MPDTNVLISVALFPNSISTQALHEAMNEHTLVICTYIIAELEEVFNRKFPDKINHLRAYMSKLAYELCPTPIVTADTPAMRDEDDRPILQAAIDENVDVILTCDKDFHALDIIRPRIVQPSEFLKN